MSKGPKLKPDPAGRLRRREPSKLPLHTPWRQDKPSRFGMVRVYDRTNTEILVCQEHHASAIVQAVNWCSSRGYIK